MDNNRTEKKLYRRKNSSEMDCDDNISNKRKPPAAIIAGSSSSASSSSSSKQADNTKRRRQDDTTHKNASTGSLHLDDDEDMSSDEEVIDRNKDEEDDDQHQELLVDSDDEEDDEKATGRQIWRPGVDELGEDEELVYDPSTYDLYAKCPSEWPCLSFDILKDDKGACRSSYPIECSLVAGSQAENAEDNYLYVMKWSKLHRLKDEDDSDYDSDEDDDEDDDPEMHSMQIKHPHTVNRIRAMPQGKIVSTFSEDGKVYMWNIGQEYDAVEKGQVENATSKNSKPLFSYSGHKQDGFALAWNPVNSGMHLSGDNTGAVKLWSIAEGGWNVSEDASMFKGHKGSIEDLEWKKLGDGAGSVFASASSDGTVKIWDARAPSKPAIDIKAHDCDVNVLSWNPIEENLIVTGAEDGSFKIFDITAPEEHMAHFDYHQGAITSVSWHPNDETGLAIASVDNTISLWDCAVEADEDDDNNMKNDDEDDNMPPQLLFLHQGQREIMECQWHPQVPGMVISTAYDGFNVFKPCKTCNF